MYYGRDYNDYLDMASRTADYTGPVKGLPEPARPEDVTIIRDYLNKIVAVRAIAPGTAKTEANLLLQFARATSGLKGISTDEITGAIARLRSTRKKNTLARLIPLVKRFSIWLHKNQNPGIDLEEIRALKAPRQDVSGRTAAKMLTADEVTKIIAAGRTSRDHAILAMLYEGSARPIEIITAKWGDLSFDEYGCVWNTAGKTEKNRYVRLIMAAPYLKQWRNDYPEDLDPDAPLFVTLRRPHRALSSSGLRVIIEKTAARSGIKKAIFPYLFRHSRITAMIADETPESIVKSQAWGSLRTNQLATYTHLSGTDIDRVLLARAGIITDAPKTPAGVRPIQCGWCNEINAPTNKFCAQCGAGLTKEAILSKSQVEELADKKAEALTDEQIDRIAARVILMQKSKK